MTSPIWVSGRNKYGARRCKYGDHWYHSKREAEFAMRLDTLKMARLKKERVLDWKRQVPVSLDVNGAHICKWVCDFEVTYADGRVELVEVKGFETPEWKLKFKLFRALYPERELRVVK